MPRPALVATGRRPEPEPRNDWSSVAMKPLRYLSQMAFTVVRTVPARRLAAFAIAFVVLAIALPVGTASAGGPPHPPQSPSVLQYLESVPTSGGDVAAGAKGGPEAAAVPDTEDRPARWERHGRAEVDRGVRRLRRAATLAAAQELGKRPRKPCIRPGPTRSPVYRPRPERSQEAARIPSPFLLRRLPQSLLRACLVAVRHRQD